MEGRSASTDTVHNYTQVLRNLAMGESDTAVESSRQVRVGGSSQAWCKAS